MPAPNLSEHSSPEESSDEALKLDAAKATDDSRAFDEVSRCSTVSTCLPEYLELQEWDGASPKVRSTQSNSSLMASPTSSSSHESLYKSCNTEQLQKDLRLAFDKLIATSSDRDSESPETSFRCFLDFSGPVFKRYGISPSLPTQSSAVFVEAAFEEFQESMAASKPAAGGGGGYSPSAGVAGGSSSSTSTAVASAQHPPRYVLSGDLLGGGVTGIVQKGFDPATGREVAIKRLQRDSSCPLRFLELSAGTGGEATGVRRLPNLHLEGYAAAGSRMRPYSGPLAFDKENMFAKEPFQPGSLKDSILLVRRGGGCAFAEKVANAKSGGAVGVVIISTQDYTEEYSLGNVAGQPLPSILIGASDGEAALEFIAASEAREAEAEAGGCQRCCVAAVRTDAEHEVAIYRSLPPHPNLIQMLDTWNEGDTAIVVSECCTGGTIFMRRDPKTDRCNVKTGLWLLKQLLSGIAHLHEHGVVHRDLKPDNLLMTHQVEDSNARLVIIDFSMSALTRSMTVPCGSAQYLAPEVIAGRYGPARDVWAVGVVAYELLWGAHPFYVRGDSDEAIIQAICRPNSPLVPPRPRSAEVHPDRSSDDVPVSVCELMRLLLHRDPALRLTAAQALAHPALEDVALPH